MKLVGGFFMATICDTRAVTDDRAAETENLAHERPDLPPIRHDPVLKWNLPKRLPPDMYEGWEYDETF